jgi:hypothetical protein
VPRSDCPPSAATLVGSSDDIMSSGTLSNTMYDYNLLPLVVAIKFAEKQISNFSFLFLPNRTVVFYEKPVNFTKSWNFLS